MVTHNEIIFGMMVFLRIVLKNLKQFFKIVFQSKVTEVLF